MSEFTIQPGPFDPTWESLRTFECPRWFREAKLGIWAHWGPQSAPMVGDWYARNMYIEGHDQYRYHWRRYGHPSKFGYKDVVKLWKAENFDPEGLMDLYVKAGARYFVAQAVHHDNFDNWDSRHHPWNAVNVGPRKNIVQLFQDAARKRGLRFGVTEHLGATFKWFATNKGADAAGPYTGAPYDGNDAEYESLYLPNKGETLEGWYTDNPWWHEQWFRRMKDLVDQHQPDLLYSDGGLPFYRPKDGVVCPAPGLHLVAHLYNTSARRHGTNEAVYTQKDTDPQVYTVGVLDIERGMQREIAAHPWQTDTCVGGWFYSTRQVYKSPKLVLDMLINIVSKNGNLLLNFPQRPDGTLDDECLHILDCMAKWMAVNGEAIHDTHPWTVAGEGPLLAPDTKAFQEPELDWTDEDYRFTAKGDALYAFQMKWPASGKAFIRSLAADVAPPVRSVRLLGHDGALEFQQTWCGLGVRLPQENPGEFARCLKIELAG